MNAFLHKDIFRIMAEVAIPWFGGICYIAMSKE